MQWHSIKLGIYGGLAGGLVFGLMMGMMGMLPMIGSMVGMPSAAAGFLVHMGISAVIGAGYAIALSVVGRQAGVVTGSAYGVTWWVLGPLTLMPAFMGMGIGVNWTIAAMIQAVPSLMGHVIFGLVLGLTYRWLEHQHWSPAHHVGAA